jgi:hypothetical protein
MRFGGPVELSDAPVMDIEAPTGRYWRVMVFHEYAGNGWINTDVNSIIIDENEQTLSVPDFESRREITQTITLRQRLGPQGTIAAAAQPLRSDLPLLAVVGDVTQEVDEGELPEISPVVPLLGDPSVLYSRKELRAGEAYQVVSSLTRAHVESLRAAGEEYPDWVVPRYLQLPDSLPERIRFLAEQVTAGRETPYQKAVAIERYLRDIPYNERIDGPAPEQDGVDYFLFDAKEGYCDYYASAMVVMLRSVGVPARFVRGYSQGSREEGIFSIQERDGHAWPEVFFPGYGWVEFEPTAGEPVLLRPRAEDDTLGGIERFRDQPQPDEAIEDPFEPDRLGPIPEVTPEPFLQRLGRWGGLGLGLAAVVMGIVALLTFRRHRRIEGLTVAERVYEDLINWVRRLLRIAPLTHQTPNEYGAAVARVLPAGRQPVRRIVDTYVGYRFGGRTVDGDEVETAWRDTQKALWQRWLWRQGERLSAFPRRLLPMAPPKPPGHEKDVPMEQ